MTDTYVDSRDSALLVVSIGDGASPEVFTPKCSINKNRSLDLTAEISTQKLPNCTDPTKPAKVVKKVVAVDWSVSGDGMLNSADALFFTTWHASGLPKNIKVNVGATTGDLVWTGPALLEQFTTSGAGLGELVAAAMKLTGSGGGAGAAHG